MKASDCFSPGFIVKAHGLKGGVMGKFTVKNPSDYSGLDVLFIEQRGQLVPFLIESISFKEDTVYIKFEGVENSEEASALRSAKLFLPAELAPETSEDDPNLLINYRLVDTNFGDIGFIREFMMAGSQETLIVENEKTDILIPFVPEIIQKIDHKLRSVFSDCPEGLIDMYLNE